MDMMQKNESIFLGIRVIVDKNDLWMLSYETDVLLHFDFDNMKLLDYFILPGREWVQYAHLDLEKNGDRIYLLPYAKSNFCYFDMKLNTLKEIDIPYIGKEEMIKDKFAFITSWKSHVILIGHSVRGIFCYDEENDCFSRETRYLKELEKAGCNISNPLFGECHYQNKNELFLPVFNERFILQIDLESNSYKIYKLLAEKEIRLCTIDAFVENGMQKFLLTTTNDDMLIWTPENGIEKMKNLGLLQGQQKKYREAFCVNGKNYYIASDERRFFKETHDEIQELFFDSEIEDSIPQISGSQFGAVFKSKNNIYFQLRPYGNFFKIDTSKEQIKRIDYNVPLEKKREILNQLYHNRENITYLLESGFYGIDRFLRMII